MTDPKLYGLHSWESCELVQHSGLHPRTSQLSHPNLQILESVVMRSCNAGREPTQFRPGNFDAEESQMQEAIEKASPAPLHVSILQSEADSAPEWCLMILVTA